MAVRKPSIHFSPAISARNNRSFDFVIGEPASAECYCTKLKCVQKQLIINEIFMEAAGVELITVLIARKLLIPGTATTAKKAPSPDPLYVYCTKMLFALQSNRHHTAATVSHRFSEMDRKSTSLPAIPRVTPFDFFGTPVCRLDYVRVARHSGGIAVMTLRLSDAGQRQAAKLRQVQVESVNFARTQVAREQGRAVGSDAAPCTGYSDVIAMQVLQIG
jgi:hypothetical protein